MAGEVVVGEDQSIRPVARWDLKQAARLLKRVAFHVVAGVRAEVQRFADGWLEAGVAHTAVEGLPEAGDWRITLTIRSGREAAAASTNQKLYGVAGECGLVDKH